MQSLRAMTASNAVAWFQHRSGVSAGLPLLDDVLPIRSVLFGNDQRLCTVAAGDS